MKTVLIFKDASHYGARAKVGQHFSETQAYALLAPKVEGEGPEPVTDSAVVFQCLQEAMGKLISLAGVGTDNVTGEVDVEILPDGRKHFLIDLAIEPAPKAAEAPAAEPPPPSDAPPAEPPPAEPPAPEVPAAEPPAPASEGDAGVPAAPPNDATAGT